MRGWTSATATELTCARSYGHRLKEGDRVFALQSSGWARRKVYCAGCAVQYMGAPADTGELLEVVDSPNNPLRAVDEPPLRALAESVRSALFDEPFEEAAPMPFDAKMAAAGRDD